MMIVGVYALSLKFHIRKN